MKLFAVAFVLCFFSCLTFAADTTIVRLMQKVIDLEVDKSYSYYHLLDEAKNPYKYDFGGPDFDKNDTLKNIPLNDFWQSIKNDTSKLNWSAYNFPKAKCVDYKHLPRHISNSRVLKFMDVNTKQSVIDSLESNSNVDLIIVRIKANANQRQRERAKKKTLEKIYSRPLEESNYFTFSKPIFSQDKQYAYITIRASLSGKYCIFKNDNGVWKLLYAVRWIA
jgi:hypothetical protein